MAAEDSNIDYWSLSPAQLASGIKQIAQSDSAAISDATRAEAGQLAAEWHDAINLPKDTFENQEAQVAQLDALQRRTIEILIRTGLMS
jgi:hypothetical protein